MASMALDGSPPRAAVRRDRTSECTPMDLRQLEYFAAVARHRHFRRAAESLYVTQSAVSQAVRRLEAELGLELLRRRPGAQPPVEVTPAGEDLLARAEAILADVAQARAAMDEHAGTLRGGVRAAATAGDALRVAAELARFGREHPGVRIALRQCSADRGGGLGRLGRLSSWRSRRCRRAWWCPTDVGARPRCAPSRWCCSSAADDPLAGASGREAVGRARPAVRPGRAGQRAARRRRCARARRRASGRSRCSRSASRPRSGCSSAPGSASRWCPESWAVVDGPEVGVARVAAAAARHELTLLTRAAGPSAPSPGCWPSTCARRWARRARRAPRPARRRACASGASRSGAAPRRRCSNSRNVGIERTCICAATPWLASTSTRDDA